MRRKINHWNRTRTDTNIKINKGHWKGYYNGILYVWEVRGKVKYVKYRHERYKKTQIELLEVKTIMSEMKNTLDGINSKIHVAEEM